MAVLTHHTATGDAAQAVTDYRRAIAGWDALGHQYDCARACGNASRALAAAGEIEEACAAIDRALHIAETLAVQLVGSLRPYWVSWGWCANAAPLFWGPFCLS
jgi:tetratricopeptide (TPR) repeat protein